MRPHFSPNGVLNSGIDTSSDLCALPSCLAHILQRDPTASHSLEVSEAPVSCAFCKTACCEAHDAVSAFKTKAAKLSENLLKKWYCGAMLVRNAGKITMY
eukprot:gb/GEZN01012875.1/.p1 GENE.gb/GEZN01012875.1/~~gb/GEZN01012875.1/.p1  ORF type:complete len:100 (-),score=0.39 gb/GEZN01012875.1/:85-384(-)